jgi:hypothetical protein
MDALRRSVAEEKRTSGTEKRSRKRIEGQKEMLLPILGKKGKAASSKLAARLEYSVVEGWLIAIPHFVRLAPVLNALGNGKAKDRP